MTTYALDSDTTTLLLRGHPAVCKRAAEVEAEQLSATIITVEEILTGWYTQIRRAKKDDQVLRAYVALQQAVEFFGRIRILPMDADGLQRFHAASKKQMPRGNQRFEDSGHCSASFGATVVTRNLRDFKRLARFDD